MNARRQDQKAPRTPSTAPVDLTQTASGPSESRSLERPGDDWDDGEGPRISHYRLHRRLGAGGMGQVYLATDEALGRTAAIKILPRAFSADLRERLFLEAWASARLQHPAIATFYEAGEADGVAFIAMEYVEGDTLRDVLDCGPLSRDQSIAVTTCLLEALGHAHAADILHRDIKPENIMCTGSRSAKLLDFGLAKHLLTTIDDGGPGLAHPEQATAATDETLLYQSTHPVDDDTDRAEPHHSDNLTRAGNIVGTLGYMAPEQVRGEAVDPRTDLFAVGAVLFEMLTGRRAFPGDTVQERLAAVLHQDPLTQPSVGLPDDLAGVVQRALAKDADARYPSAQDFLTDLGESTGPEAATSTAHTVAVLSFENASDNRELGWLSGGIADDLAQRLASLPDVTPVPRPRIAAVEHTVFGTPEQIGLHLGCRWLITGSYTDRNDELAVEARLVDVPTSVEIGRSAVRARSDDLFQLQDRLFQELAAKIGSGAGVPHDSGRGALSVKAYECCVRARRELLKYEKGSFEQAYQLFSRAIELDPDYAVAFAGMSQISGMRFLFNHDQNMLDRAEEFARRAIELDPDLADGYVWLSYTLGQQVFVHIDKGQEDAARTAFTAIQQSIAKALEIDPAHPMAAYFAASYTNMGCRFATSEEDRTARRVESIDLYRRTLQFSPHSCWSWLGLGWAHLDSGSPVEAIWCLEKAVDLEPKVQPPTAGVAVFLGECLRRVGRYDAAREQCLAGLEATERSDHMYRDTFRGVGLCALGRTALRQQDLDAAKTAFHQAELHLRGRTRARIGGQLLVQALAGLTQCGEGPSPYHEARELLKSRRDYEYGWLWWGWDEISLLELARAARTVGDTDQADALRARAVAAGSVEARDDPW